MFMDTDNENYLLINLLLQEEKQKKNHELKIQRKNLRDRSNPFDVADAFFTSHYRLDKPTAMYLIDFLKPKCIEDINLNTIPIHFRILCVLIFYGHGPGQKITGLNFGLPLSQTSVSRCIQQITELIVKHLTPTVVKFPTSPEEILIIKSGFYSKFGLPGIIGAIDGVHIAILSPPKNSNINLGHLYRNRKGYHSIIAMMVCDSNLKLIYADARYPGSFHDAAVWQVSNLKAQVKTIHNQNSWLLGDSGYPIEPWLLTPIINPTSNSEKLYNKMHIRRRNVIERCFGVLKSRFRCIHRYQTLYYAPLKAIKIIYAVATLHNLCIDRKIGDVENEGFEQNDNDEPLQRMESTNILQRGRLSRQKYINDYILNINS